MPPSLAGLQRGKDTVSLGEIPEAEPSLLLKVFDDFSHRFRASFRTRKIPNNKDTHLESRDGLRLELARCCGTCLISLISQLCRCRNVFSEMRETPRACHLLCVHHVCACSRVCVWVTCTDVCGGQRSTLVALPQRLFYFHFLGKKRVYLSFKL